MDEPIAPESRPAGEREPAIPPTIFEHLDDHEKPASPVSPAFEEPRKSKILPVLLAVLVVVILLGGGYYAYRKLFNKKITSTNTTASSATTAADTSSGNSNLNVSIDDQLDKDMADVNSQFKSLSSETSSADTGMADQPVDLNSD